MPNNEPDESKPYICFDKFITDEVSAIAQSQKAKVCSNYYENNNFDTNAKDFITNVKMSGDEGGCCFNGEEENTEDNKIGDLKWDGKEGGAKDALKDLKKFKIYKESDIKKYLALKYIYPYKQIWSEKINVTKYFACPDMKECTKFNCEDKEKCGANFSGIYNKKYGDWGQCGKTKDGKKNFCRRNEYCKIEDGVGKCQSSEFECPRDWGEWGFGSSWSWGSSFPSWGQAKSWGWSWGDWSSANRENSKRCGFRNMEGFSNPPEYNNNDDVRDRIKSDGIKVSDNDDARDNKCLDRPSSLGFFANYFTKKEDSPLGVYGDPYTVTFKQKIEDDLRWNNTNSDHIKYNVDEWDLGKQDGSSNTIQDPERHLNNRKRKIWTENRDTSRAKLQRCFAKFKTLFIGLDEDLLKIETLLGGITVKDRNKAYEVEEELRKFNKVKNGEEELKKLQEFDRASYIFYEIFFYSMLITVSGLFIKNQLND